MTTADPEATMTRPAPADRRPNVLWVCADDYTPDACGAYGNGLVRTPNLDALIGRGVRFDRAFCNCPLSTPSRQSFWTGRYPRSVGVTLSRTPLPADEVTLPELLQAAGYHTAAFGKTHYYAPRRAGLDRMAGHAEFHDWQAGRPPPPPTPVETLGPWRPFYDPAYVWLNGQGLPAAGRSEDLPDGFFADRAVEFLRGRHDRPFFLYVSFDATHSPFRFPAALADRHRPEVVRPPAVPDGLEDRIPPPFVGLSDVGRQRIIASYYTAAEFLDANVGRVLGALAGSGRDADTVVVFTSDHGYMLGQRGRFEKHCCYDPAIRVALAVAAPGVTRPRTTSAALVELIDLAPTLLELCGVPVPPNLHGRSLLPVLRGGAAAHRDAVFVEYADNAEMAVRTDRWKLIYTTGRRARRDGYGPYHGPGARGPGADTAGPVVELYDLYDDPGELNDLAGRPAYRAVRDDLLSRLADHADRTYRGVRPPAGADIHERLAHLLPPVEAAVR